MRFKHLRDMRYEDMPTGMLISCIMRSHIERIRHSLESYGVQKTYGPILKELSISEGMTQTELAELMRITAPSMSVNLQKMENSGFLTRRTDDADLRHIRLFLTDKGRDVAKKADREIALSEDALVNMLSQDEHRELRRLLIKILESQAR